MYLWTEQRGLAIFAKQYFFKYFKLRKSDYYVSHFPLFKGLILLQFSYADPTVKHIVFMGQTDTLLFSW